MGMEICVRQKYLMSIYIMGRWETTLLELVPGGIILVKSTNQGVSWIDFAKAFTLQISLFNKDSLRKYSSVN